jgi:alkyl sulfatase BDS1-like metallo-beta-lactamase superfamily hydrolase
LNRIQLGETTLEAAVAAGEVQVDGRQESLSEFLGMLDRFDFWFNVVTP